MVKPGNFGGFKPPIMQIYQVDAFAGGVFQGNPAAVVPLKEWLSDDLLQSIAMENNLSETAYFVPAGRGFSIRWFTPTVEVDLCGHATLASGHVLFEHLGFSGDAILFHTRRAGDLQVLRGDAPGRYTLNFPETPPEPVDPESLGILFEGLHIPTSQLVFKGPYDYLIVLGSQREVEALRPDFKKLSGAPGRGVIVTAPGEDGRFDFVSRGFFPQSGIDEDPVTGSAHSMLVPYWASRLGRTRLSAALLSARRGYLDCRLDRGRVYMTGNAHTFLKGELLLGEEGGELTVRKAQRMVDHWIRTTGVRYFSELTNMAILTEEVGEVARLMSRLYGDQSFKETDKGRELSDELTDVLWVLLCIANQTGVDLAAALEKNFAKKSIRDVSRHRENEKLREENEKLRSAD
jgi:PhzF family phenazine biosynthesis protein